MFVVIPIRRIFLSSSNATDMTSVSAWNSGTSYLVGNLVYLDKYVYQCTRAHTNLTPAENYEYWTKVKYREEVWTTSPIYKVGDIYSYNRRVYKSLFEYTDQTLAAVVPPSYPEKSNDYWVDVGPVNKWAMFDLESSAQTIRDNYDNLTASFYTYQAYNTIAIFGMVGTTLTLTGTDSGGGTTYYTKSVTLSTLDPPSGFDYAVPVGTSYRWVVFDDVPTSYPDMKMTIAVSSSSPNRPIKCGQVVVGMKMPLGDVDYGLQNDSLNFSDVNSDLNSTLTSIPSKTKVTVQSAIDYGTALSNAKFARDALNGVPALWCPIDKTTDQLFPVTAVLGYYKQFNIQIDNPAKAVLGISVESI